MKKNFSKLTIIALIICAIVTIMFTIFEIETEKNFEIVFSTYTIATYVILTEHGLATYNKPKLKYLAIFSFIVNTIGCILYLGLIWGIIEICLFSCKSGDNSEFLLKVLTTTSILSILTSVVSKTLEIENNNPKVVSLKNALFILGTILAFTYLEGIWFDIISDIIDSEIYGKIIFILSVAFVLLIIIIPIYNSISKNKIQNEILTDKQNTIVNEVTNIIKKKCSVCNYDLEDNWNYCPICSTKIEQIKNNLE